MWTSRPVQGDIGIVYVPEAERFMLRADPGRGG